MLRYILFAQCIQVFLVLRKTGKERGNPGRSRSNKANNTLLEGKGFS
jgi:hypothetical protein